MSTSTDKEGYKGARYGWRRLSLRDLRELGIIVGSYIVYMVARRFLIPDIESEAFANALKVVSFESAAGLLLEAQWQGWVLEHSKALVVLMNWVYIATFIPILALAAVLVYFKDRSKYIYYRRVWLLSFVLALMIFVLFPLAPPRFLPEYGFVDAIQKFGPSWYGGTDMAQAIYYNVFAAMPSLHFGWTILFGVLFFRMGPLWLKVCGVLYPLMTFFAITITGNHYIMDAVGGAGVAALSYVSYEALVRTESRFGSPVRSARGHLGRVGANAWTRAVRLATKAGSLRVRPAAGPAASPLRGQLLRWRVKLVLANAAVRSHPWVEWLHTRLYARKWKTGFPSS